MIIKPISTLAWRTWRLGGSNLFEVIQSTRYSYHNPNTGLVNPEVFYFSVRHPPPHGVYCLGRKPRNRVPINHLGVLNRFLGEGWSDALSRRGAKAKGWLTAIVLAGAAAGSAHAGQIIAGHIADGHAGTLNDGAPATIGANVNLNNDVASAGTDPADASNGVSLNLDWTATAPLTAAFDVRDSGGVTEYKFNINFVNASGIDWTGLVVELGHLDGSGNFSPGTFPGLDFDKSPGDAADVMPWYVLEPNVFFYLPPSVSPQTHTLDTVAIDASAFMNDIIRANGANTFSHFLGVSIDVPDDPGLAAWQGGEEDYRFALRLSPIPEPGTAAVTAVSAAALLMRRRRA